MAPVQASVDSQSLVVDNYDVVILTCAILSFLFILMFILVVFLARQSIARRCRIYGKVLHRTTTPPDLRSPRAHNARKETLSPLTVSALVLQSIPAAFHHFRLGIVPNNLWPPSAARCPKDTLSHGLEPEPPLWRRANVRQFGFAASPSGGDGSRLIQTIWFLPTALCGLRKRLFFGLFAGLRQAPSLSARKSAECQRQALVVVEPTEATGEPSLDVLGPDIVGVPEIFLHTEAEIGTLPMPLIILSLPSSENLGEDPSLPVSLDEDLLSPDGTFRSSGRLARVADHDISYATRLALASRLRHRQKRAIIFLSPDVLSSPRVVRWPRWL
jgi:hypothetical protein